MQAIRLRTEHMENPMGIDVEHPYLSWNCEGGITQTAYEIRALEGEAEGVVERALVGRGGRVRRVERVGLVRDGAAFT